MIIVNSHKFAETEKEFFDSLFAEKTCYGYAKICKRAIKFFNIQKIVIGAFNSNGIFICGRPAGGGKTWWSYGEPPFLAEYKDAIHEGKYREWRGIVEKFINDYAKGHDHRGYYFK